jgi:hypothetical protein
MTLGRLTTIEEMVVRKVIAGVALLFVIGAGAGQYTFAQDEPATPEVYEVPCGTPSVVASPETATVPPEANATVDTSMELAGMNATPDASPGLFACASPEGSPTP